MTYQQTLDFLFNSLPMFQRIGAAAYKSDLSTTIELNKRIGNPELNFPSIHIAGTNGKGSTSSMIASVLQENGYKVGLYTSPHLKDFRERIRVNGKMISEEYVSEFVEKNSQLFEELKPSFFEMTFALASEYFSREKVDFAVMEVGMGGRLDSTNIVRSVLSVITNIGFDHTAFLGNTKQLIAAEKGGIIKAGIPVIIGETQDETTAIFDELAHKNASPIYYADKIIKIKEDCIQNNYRKFTINLDDFQLFDLEIPFLGNYQRKNLKTVLAVIEVGNSKNIFKTTEDKIKSGLYNTIHNTGFSGRWQILSQQPFTVADTAHNEDGISQVMAQLNEIEANRKHFVLGVVNDKDLSNILRFFPQDGIYYFCKPNIPRGLDAKVLQNEALKFNLKGDTFDSCLQAYEFANSKALKNDLIYIGGSTFVVAEIL